MSNELQDQSPEKESAATPDDLAASFSREFLVFDVLPVVVIATVVSIALAGTDGASEAFSGTRLVESTLQATPSALVIWWFSIVGAATLARPFLRWAVGAARLDGTLSKREIAKARGPLAQAIEAHVRAAARQEVELENNGAQMLTISQLRLTDPSALGIVMDHRERWEVSLRLSLASFVSGVASAVVLHSWTESSTCVTVGAVCGILLYRQSATEFSQYSRVVLAALRPTGTTVHRTAANPDSF